MRRGFNQMAHNTPASPPASPTCLGRLRGGALPAGLAGRWSPSPSCCCSCSRRCSRCGLGPPRFLPCGQLVVCRCGAGRLVRAKAWVGQVRRVSAQAPAAQGYGTGPSGLTLLHSTGSRSGRLPRLAASGRLQGEAGRMREGRNGRQFSRAGTVGPPGTHPILPQCRAQPVGDEFAAFLRGAW